MKQNMEEYIKHFLSQLQAACKIYISNITIERLSKLIERFNLNILIKKSRRIDYNQTSKQRESPQGILCTNKEWLGTRALTWKDVHKMLLSGKKHVKSSLYSLKVKGGHWYPTLCNPRSYTVHGVLQARIPDWVAFPFSRGSSQPRDRAQVSCIAGRFFTFWTTREASN